MISIAKNIKVLIILYITSVLFLSFLVPPFQSPDEFNHFKRAYLLAEGEIILKKMGNSTGSQIDDNLLEYMGLHSTIPFHGSQKYTSDIFKKGYELNWTNKKSFSDLSNIAPYFPLIYAPQALILKFGQATNLNIDLTYRLSKFFVFLCVLVILFVAYKFNSINYPVLVLFALPMSMFMVASSHPDVLFWSICILIISLTKDLFINKKLLAFKNILKFALLLFLVFCLASNKATFTPIYLLPLIIAYRSKSFQFYISILIVFLINLLWLYVSEQSHGPIRQDAETYNSLSSLIDNLPIFFESLVATFSNLKFYKVAYQSFIGNLGWLDAKLNSLWYFVYGFILIHITIKLKSKLSNNSKYLKLDYIFLIISLLSFGLLILVTFIKWLPIGELVNTQQGRYFYPLLIFILSMEKFNIKYSDQNNYIFFLLPFFLIFLTYSIVIFRLITRYYLM